MKRTKRSLIKELRTLGGQWVANRNGFGTYWYEGILENSNYEVRSYSHLSPGYHIVLWHIKKDGKDLAWPTIDPICIIRNRGLLNGS